MVKIFFIIDAKILGEKYIYILKFIGGHYGHGGTRRGHKNQPATLHGATRVPVRLFYFGRDILPDSGHIR